MKEFVEEKVPWKVYLEMNKDLWKKVPTKANKNDSEMPAETGSDEKAQAKGRPNSKAKRNLEELELDDKDTNPLPDATYLCLFDGCKKCAVFSPHPLVQEGEGLTGPICCKKHISCFRQQTEYQGRKFFQTHNGSNWHKLYFSDKPVLAPKARTRKWRKNKKRLNERGKVSKQK